MGNKKYRTDFLFSNSSFLTGLGSIFNISGNYYSYNISRSEQEADARALESDWGMISQDMKIAAGRLNKEIADEQFR